MRRAATTRSRNNENESDRPPLGFDFDGIRSFACVAGLICLRQSNGDGSRRSERIDHVRVSHEMVGWSSFPRPMGSLSESSKISNFPFRQIKLVSTTMYIELTPLQQDLRASGTVTAPFGPLISISPSLTFQYLPLERVGPSALGVWNFGSATKRRVSRSRKSTPPLDHADETRVHHDASCHHHHHRHNKRKPHGRDR